MIFLNYLILAFLLGIFIIAIFFLIKDVLRFVITKIYNYIKSL